MTEPTKIEMPTAAWGLLSALNIVIDALVTAHPPAGEHIARSLQAKIEEWKKDPDMQAAAPVLGMVLSAMTTSARRLQRDTPAGRA